eukprot:1194962-Prorocentrum_minimum.AAC.3
MSWGTNWPCPIPLVFIYDLGVSKTRQASLSRDYGTAENKDKIVGLTTTCDLTSDIRAFSTIGHDFGTIVSTVSLCRGVT